MLRKWVALINQSQRKPIESIVPPVTTSSLSHLDLLLLIRNNILQDTYSDWPFPFKSTFSIETSWYTFIYSSIYLSSLPHFAILTKGRRVIIMIVYVRGWQCRAGNDWIIQLAAKLRPGSAFLRFFKFNSPVIILLKSRHWICKKKICIEAKNKTYIEPIFSFLHTKMISSTFVRTNYIFFCSLKITMSWKIIANRLYGGFRQKCAKISNFL